MKIRADVALVEQGLAPTRARAQALILAGRVFWGERRVEKAGTSLPPGAELRLQGVDRYVSRGGLKLQGALDGLAFDPRGLVAVDVGASTGGFTDCLLQRGASRVFAVDVGHGQLADPLRRDERVVVMERTNARHLTRENFDHPIDLVVVDASFISIDKLIEPIAGFVNGGGHLLALVKPQFEAGRAEANRGKGVIRDPEIREAAIDRARQAIAGAGFTIEGEVDSTVHGPKGNVERFVLARRNRA
jgi:23S rRNA (cytidine1920-2'-O)/16S rRNA (cytidine1409-2'-O)-methyltransferase